VQDLALPRGQRFQAGVGRGRPRRSGELLKYERGQARAEVRVAGGHPLDRRDQLGGVDGLRHISERAGADHRHHVLRGVRDRQREHTRRILGRSQGTQDGHAPVRNMDVEQDDIGRGCVNRGDRLGRSRRLPDHLAVVLELCPDPGAEEVMVIDHDDAQA